MISSSPVRIARADAPLLGREMRGPRSAVRVGVQASMPSQRRSVADGRRVLADSFDENEGCSGVGPTEHAVPPATRRVPATHRTIRQNIQNSGDRRCRPCFNGATPPSRRSVTKCRRAAAALRRPDRPPLEGRESPRVDRSSHHERVSVTGEDSSPCAASPAKEQDMQSMGGQRVSGPDAVFPRGLRGSAVRATTGRANRPSLRFTN